MAAALPPITLPADYKPAPLHVQIEAVTRQIYRVGEDERRGHIHPDRAALRRWELKSALQTLQRVAADQQGHGRAEPEASTR